MRAGGYDVSRLRGAKGKTMRHLIAAALLSVMVCGPACGAKPTPPDPRSVGELTKAMGIGPTTLRLAAARALGQKGKQVVPLLIKTLGHKDWKMRRGATDALAQLGPAAAAAVGPLTKALADEDPWIRDGAACALGRIGPAAAPAAKAMVRALKGADDWIAESVMAALPSITKDKETLLAAALLVVEMPSSSYSAKRYAAGIVRRHGKGDKRVVGPIVKQLSHRGEGMWRGADNQLMDALGTTGAAARPAVGALTKLLGHRHKDVRAKAAETLGKIGKAAAAAVPALKAQAADDKDPAARTAAAKALTLIE